MVELELVLPVVVGSLLVLVVGTVSPDIVPVPALVLVLVLVLVGELPVVGSIVAPPIVAAGSVSPHPMASNSEQNKVGDNLYTRIFARQHTDVTGDAQAL
ncbi:MULTISPECIES: hypothetical protein [Nannocystis]|uniref:Secreted protein n=1 Tax=Nannocystis radixulma TaxID=2995305 RepID=A0ABT5B3N5_9BACT|nr:MULTISPECIES: hypothetical protein [Nannocystis]MCY1057582.1 hypothetical protein [Nannocystis sp. SCPEA4]MDC0667747.1 hypothetical protein [Nannocystis radixulma]